MKIMVNFYEILKKDSKIFLSKKRMMEIIHQSVDHGHIPTQQDMHEL